MTIMTPTTEPSPEPSTRTLEKLVHQTPGKDLSQKDVKLQAALLLSLYGAAQSVVGKGVLATPLYGITYDADSNHLKFELFDGIARVPQPGRYTVSSFDMIFACHARDLPLVFEGDTGVGKTLTTEGYLKTVLPAESSVQMSLSHQGFTDSPKAPFERSEMRQGMPVTLLDKKNLRKIAAMYLDELNLGNPNDLLQLSYGRVLLSNERAIAGIPIPQLTEDGFRFDEEEYLKRLWLSGSQNPPQSRDAAFSGVELTASMKNRILVITYPKIVQSVGSTMWLVNKENGLHTRFLDQFAQRYQALTGLSMPTENLQEEWLTLYAYTLDSSRTEKAVIKSALEFGDVVMGILSGDLAKAYEMEKATASEWNTALSAGNSFLLTESIQDTEEVKRLKKVIDSFDKPLTERDDANLKSLADLFSTVKSLKRAYGAAKPLEVYLRSPAYVTVEDVAASATLLARNKQMLKEAADPVVVINAALHEYVGLIDDFAKKMHIRDYTTFELENPNLGLKHIIYSTAMRDIKSADEGIMKLRHNVEELKRLAGGSDIRKYIIARTVADIATMTGFMSEHKDEITALLTDSQSDQKGETLRRQVRDIYLRETGNPIFPEIYTHRLPRVV